MAIITIVLGFTVSSLGHVSRSDSLQKSQQLVATSIELARTTALSQQQRTALVFDNQPSSKALDYRWRRFVVAIEKTDAQGNRQWVPLRNWELLPQGVLFTDQENNLATKPSWLNFAPTIEITTGRNQQANLPALIFNSRGSVELDSTTRQLSPQLIKQRLTLWLANGVVINQGNQVRSRKATTPIGVQISPLTGSTNKIWLPSP